MTPSRNCAHWRIVGILPTTIDGVAAALGTGVSSSPEFDPQRSTKHDAGTLCLDTVAIR